MRLTPFVSMALCALTIGGIGIARISAQPAREQGACGQILAACRDAGFAPGALLLSMAI